MLQPIREAGMEDAPPRYFPMHPKILLSPFSPAFHVSRNACVCLLKSHLNTNNVYHLHERVSARVLNTPGKKSIQDQLKRARLATRAQPKSHPASVTSRSGVFSMYCNFDPASHSHTCTTLVNKTIYISIIWI